MSAKDILKKIKDKEIEYVDLRFTDPRGKLQHVTPVSYTHLRAHETREDLVCRLVV